MTYNVGLQAQGKWANIVYYGKLFKKCWTNLREQVSLHGYVGGPTLSQIGEVRVVFSFEEQMT